MKRQIFFLTALIAVMPVLLTGCASLTKSQLAAINLFGQSTKSFSMVPGKLYGGYIDLHERSLLYAANKFTDPTQHYENLYKIYELKKKQSELNAKLDLTFKIIDKYGQALVLLSSDKHGKLLDTAAQKAGGSMEDLVGTYNKINAADPLPSGIGGLMSGAISAGGNAYIHQKQSDIIKKVVPQANGLISKLMDNLKAFLKGDFKTTGGNSLSYRALLDAEKSEIRNNYISFLGLHKQDLSLNNNGRQVTGYIQQTRFATIENDKDCIKMLSDLDALGLAYDQTLSAVGQLKTAHQQLTENIEQKKTLKEIAADVESYGNTVEKLYETFKKIK